VVAQQAKIIASLEGEVKDLRRVLRDTTSRLSHAIGECVGKEADPRCPDAFWNDRLYTVAMERLDMEQLMQRAVDECETLKLELARERKAAALGNKARLVDDMVLRLKTAESAVGFLQDERAECVAERDHLRQALTELEVTHAQLLDATRASAEEALTHEQRVCVGLDAIKDENVVSKGRVEALETMLSALGISRTAAEQELETLRGETQSQNAELAKVRAECAELSLALSDVSRQKEQVIRALDARVARLELQLASSLCCVRVSRD
jgi:chromosome segregation ATPase